MPRHLLIVAYAFPPISAVGAMRPLRMVKYLRQYTDWRATVISVDRPQVRQDPTLLSEVPAEVAVHRLANFEPYELLERLTARRQVSPSSAKSTSHAGGTPDQPEPSPRSGSRQLLRDLFTTPDGQGWWNLPVFVRSLTLHHQQPFDAVLVTSPPWSLQLVGAALSKLLRIPWIADYRDPWNDIDRRERSPFFERVSERMEQAVLPHAAAVLSTSDAYTEILRRRFPERPASVFVTLHNGFDEAKIPMTPVPAAAPFTIVHLGTLYEIWRPYAFFDALVNWFQRHPDRRPHVRLKFVGRPGARTRARISSLGLDDITEITGYVEHEEAIRQCRAADLLLLALGSCEGVPAGWLPSKLFEYIAFNRPILANVGPGEAKRLIESAGAGHAIADDDEEGFHTVLDDFFARKRATPGGQIPWRNDPEAVARLTQRHLVQELAAILERVARRNGSR